MKFINKDDQLQKKEVLTQDSNPELHQEITHILSNYFEEEVGIESVVSISEPNRRNLVQRITINLPASRITKSIIFKQAHPEKSKGKECNQFSRFARDWAGLEFLSCLKSESPSAPQFYGGSKENHFVLFEDFGKNHVSLVDSLTGNDKNYAVAALQSFMKRLGQFHSDSYENIQIYQRILEGLTAGTPPEIDDRQNNFTDVESVFKKINISYTPEFQTEMGMILKSNLDSSPFITFIHGDICPDNVFDDMDKDELHLIDFEWGFIRSALLDGTYLRMNMPTCWCAKAIPEDLIDSLEEIYRQELISKIPAARSDECYRDAYILACGFWVIKAFLLIEDVLDKEDIWGSGPIPDKSLWNPDENFVRPRILSRLKTFSQISQQSNKLPQLQNITQKILSNSSEHSVGL